MATSAIRAMSAIRMKLNIPVNQIIKNAGINDTTAIFAAGEARKLMNDYVPMKTGALCNRTYVYTENGKGVILYVQPYARFCYYNEKKVFNRDMHEKASAYWDKAMMSSHKDTLIKNINNYIKSIKSKRL